MRHHFPTPTPWRRARIAAAAATLALLTGAAAAQPAVAPVSDLQVAVWSSSCMACHGTDGKAEGTGLRIQGLPAADIYKSLLAFKTGSRQGTIMHQHAKGYTDAELQRIAQHFGALQ
jgi:cytochrome subunit of sulfide dehydrogenase